MLKKTKQNIIHMFSVQKRKLCISNTASVILLQKMYTQKRTVRTFFTNTTNRVPGIRDGNITISNISVCLPVSDFRLSASHRHPSPALSVFHDIICFRSNPIHLKTMQILLMQCNTNKYWSKTKINIPVKQMFLAQFIEEN